MWKMKAMQNKTMIKYWDLLLPSHTVAVIMHGQDKYYSILENHSELRTNKSIAAAFYSLDITVTVTYFF